MTRAFLTIVIAFTSSVILGVPVSTQGEAGYKVVTVCEVLSDLHSYDGKNIALLGRFVATEEGFWLNESCKENLKTGDYVWHNSVSLFYDNGSAAPLGNELKPSAEALSQKLAEVRKTTHLENSGDSWAIVFGRLETREPLETALGGDGKTVYGYGFGHLNMSPARLIYVEGNIKRLSDSGQLPGI